MTNKMTNKKELSSWLKSKAKFTPRSLIIKRWQVMQRWETPYMKELASIVTSKGGHILEVGFGLGISASFIQQSKRIKQHVVIEAHPDVARRAFKLFSKSFKTGRMNLFQGFWEEVTPLLKDETFDGILFDTNPLSQETVFFHFFPFFPEAYRLLKTGGVFTYFSDEVEEISKKHLELLKAAGFKKIEWKIINVKPSKNCRYWHHKTIVAPIVHK